jgi:hypothetical protein
VPRIDKEHARKIVKKLGADVQTGRKAHDLARVVVDGVLVTTFGIRRGSSKSLGHGHIAHDLFLSPHDTIRLANCPMSREEWVRRMRAAGRAPQEEQEQNESQQRE